MFKDLLLSSKKIIGIDIRANYVNVALITQHKKHYVLEGFSRVKTTGEKENLSAAIAEGVSLLNTSIKQVAVALSDSLVMNKQITLNDSLLSPDELEAYALLEASQFVPFPIADVSIDYQIYVLPNDPKKIKLLIAATRKTSVENLTDIIKKANLQLKIVEVESNVIHHLLKNLLPTPLKTLAFVQIEIPYINFFVFNDETLLFHRTEMINTKFSTTLQLAPLITQTIHRSLEFYTSHKHEQITQFLMIENEHTFRDLKDLVQKNTGISLTILNPLKIIKLSEKISATDITPQLPYLFLSCGLSMRAYA